MRCSSSKRTYSAIWDNAPEVALDDLPQYNPWSARMLGLADWERQERTSEDVEREYERETYMPQYAYLQNHPDVLDHHALYAALYPDRRSCVCVRKNQFRTVDITEVATLSTGLIAEYLSPELPAVALVELGAGNGRIILDLARDERIQDTPVIALEKMESGCKIIRTMAQRKGLAPVVGTCNLISEDVTPLDIPEGAVFFTHAVWVILPVSAQRFVDRISRFKPKIVFHFEPFGCFHDPGTLYGQLCSAYLRINKYNMKNGDELKVLHGKSIEIVQEEHAVFGNNPYLPLSLIAWKPICAD